MENQEGKRVAKRSGGGKLALILVLVLVVLVGGYAGLCVFAGSGTYLPNTAIAGIDVSGQTREEASATLEDRLPGRLKQLSASFTCTGSTYKVSGADASADVDAAVQQAAEDQSGGFFSRGWRYLTSLAGSNRYAVPVRLEGTPAAVEQAVEECSDPEAQTTWEVRDDALVLEKGVTGRTIDTADLIRQLESQLTLLLSEGEEAETAPIEAQVTTAPPAKPDFDAIHEQLYTEASDAYLDKQTKEIVPSVTGVDFDVVQASAALDAAEEGTTVSVPLRLTEPKITTEGLQEKLFKDVLGKSSTRTGGPSNRWHNVDLACQRVNGTILLPGETFSYNALCGPYSQSGGYLKAGAYVSGKTSDTWAGGVCQLSSTIYYTTLKANLETVERTKHKYDVGYLPSGMDATVYSDSLDFKFKNNTDYPIKIEASLTKTSSGARYCNVTIYGTNATGVYGDPYSVVLSTIQPQTLYEPNSAVPQGAQPRKDPERTAYTGKKVEVHQRLRDANGKVISDTVIHTDTFSARNAVYFYNPADAALWGIDPATGLRTLPPVTPSPTPAPSATPSPSATPAPSATPSPTASASPSPEATPSPTPSAAPSATASVPPTPGPGMEPVEENPAPSASASPAA